MYWIAVLNPIFARDDTQSRDFFKSYFFKKSYYRSYFLVMLFFFNDFIYLFLESREGREKEGKRNIEVREKYQLDAFCMYPIQGLNLQPRHVS